MGHTKDGVGGEGWGNLRHRVAVRGGGLLLLLIGMHAELVPGIPTVIRQLVPR